MTLRMAAEWAPHEAVWIGFPHLDAEWAGRIDAAGQPSSSSTSATLGTGAGNQRAQWPCGIT